MPFKDVAERFDKTNPFYSIMVEFLQKWESEEDARFMKKNERIAEHVQGLLYAGIAPLIDKQLAVIFGCPFGAHESLRYHLQTYHERTQPEEWWSSSSRADREAASQYVVEGRGYYFSSMEPDVIIVGRAYRTDSLDEKLFQHFRVRQTL